jgi:F-type H+-transporting ATPase subunit delta
LRFESIARNYAEALFDLGEKAGRTAEYADLMDAVAHGIAAAPTVSSVLMSPRVTKAQKSALLAAALKGAPRDFVRFLQAVVRRGRQGLFGEIAQAYQELLDLKLNRVRAAVTVARPIDEALRKRIAARLTQVIGKEVLPHFHEDPGLLGGIVIRRRMTLLRRLLLAR